MIHINEQQVSLSGEHSIAELAEKFKPDSDIFIVNGYPADRLTTVSDGDRCVFIKKGETPAPEEFQAMLTARHTPGIQEKIRKARVAVLGLGGLGSAVAAALAKIGIGKMLLSDYDVVEPSNLNRQQYFTDQIGMLKTRALRENLLRMNPFLTLELIEEELTENSLPSFFHDVDVLVECFDSSQMKAATLRSVLTRMTKVSYIGSSGMAGYASNNSIVTKMLQPGIYMVGDDISEARPGQGLMAPRVGIAAHHQANQVLRLIVGEEERRRDEHTA